MLAVGMLPIPTAHQARKKTPRPKRPNLESKTRPRNFSLRMLSFEAILEQAWLCLQLRWLHEQSLDLDTNVWR
jgi:hypothetical protein